jgi:hypothetical protein
MDAALLLGVELLAAVPPPAPVVSTSSPQARKVAGMKTAKRTQARR